jgi:hypothetical protein
MRAEDSVATRSTPKRYADVDALLSDDIADSVHRQLAELSCEDREDAATPTELPKKLSVSSPVDDASESIAFIGSRSLECQTVERPVQRGNDQIFIDRRATRQ